MPILEQTVLEQAVKHKRFFRARNPRPRFCWDS